MKMNTLQQKQLRKLKISAELDLVEIDFDVMNLNDVGESEEGEDESTARPNEYKTKSSNSPHKDMVDSMKKLRKFALEICELTVDSKDLNQWTVSGIKIDGDTLMKQSRVTMTLSKLVKSTGKVISFKTPQCTMYPENEEGVKYHNADKMTAIIEDIIEETYSYLGGKYEHKGQLPLFPGINALKVA